MTPPGYAAWRHPLITCVLCIVIATTGCPGSGDSSAGPVSPPPPPMSETVTVRGVVRLAGGGEPVEGARVTLAGRTVVTTADGVFALPNIERAPHTLKCAARGLGPVDAVLTLSRDTAVTVEMRPAELFDFLNGTFVLWVARSTEKVRGVMFLAGGPDTRAFADPTRSFNIPEAIAVEASLQDLRARYRQLAQQHGLAILGMRPGATPEVALTLDEAAAATARDELRDSPLLMQGFSLGTFSVTRVAAQFPARVAGMVLRVPVSGIWDEIAAAPGGIPVLVATAAEDQVVTNSITVAAFQTARRSGALWAYVDERGVGHYDLTAKLRTLQVAWLEAVIALRLPVEIGGPIRALSEQDGFLGDLGTFDVLPWMAFTADRRGAAWLPTQEVASLWQTVAR